MSEYIQLKFILLRKEGEGGFKKSRILAGERKQFFFLILSSVVSLFSSYFNSKY